MKAARKAVVVGGSLGGLFAANLLLLRAGWDVPVYERVAEELQGRGARIVTNVAARCARQRLGQA